MAKPRVFVSSTYYDLKHLRSSLENFIESLGYEPILSEKGDIPYSSNVPLDESCYREVNNSDILVLIIGGRYGSESSRDEKKSSHDFYTKYDSITKGEFETAIKNQIPTYILIEKSVHSDFETYLKNRDNTSVEYAHVESINIFDLIERINNLPYNNPVHYFDSYSEIENWLKEQWAGKFKELLKTISQREQLKTLSSQVSDLSVINGTLRRYLEQIVKKVDPEQSEELITEETEHIKSYNERIHISNLKDMLRLWQQNLSSNKVAPAEGTFTFGRLESYAPSSLGDIENHALFEDIFHHFPDLRDFWNEFKTLSTTYSLERQGLIDKIEGHIKQKLKEPNFDLESETGKGFPLSVYSETVCIAKGKSSSYDYFIERVSVNGVVKSRLIYSYMGTGNGYILAEIEPERIDEVKTFHKEMIKECEELYLSDIKKIIELENKTRDSRNKLESRLGEIIYLMVFPQMDCKFVK